MTGLESRSNFCHRFGWTTTSTVVDITPHLRSQNPPFPQTTGLRPPFRLSTARLEVILEEDVKELEEHLNLPEYDAGDDFSDGSNGSWLQCWCEDGKGAAAFFFFFF